jgi:hypothetical protein
MAASIPAASTAASSGTREEREGVRPEAALPEGEAAPGPASVRGESEGFAEPIATEDIGSDKASRAATTDRPAAATARGVVAPASETAPEAPEASVFEGRDMTAEEKSTALVAMDRNGTEAAESNEEALERPKSENPRPELTKEAEATESEKPKPKRARRPRKPRGAAKGVADDAKAQEAATVMEPAPAEPVSGTAATHDVERSDSEAAGDKPAKAVRKPRPRRPRGSGKKATEREGATEGSSPGPASETVSEPKDS